MNINNSAIFVEQLNSATCPYLQFRKYGQAFVRFKTLDENTIEFLDFFSINPIDAIKLVKLICNLADTHSVILTAMAHASWIGPSITNDNTFRKGMSQKKLLKFYENFGFLINEINGKYYIKRNPKNET